MRTKLSSQESDAITGTARAAESRRSIRTYATDAIPTEDLRELLRLTGKAPSAFNVQPWRFIVVTDEATRAELSAAAFNQQQIVRAPATIVMYSDMESALERIPESMHPDMPDDKRDAGVASFRTRFATQSVEQREAWGAEQSNIALGYLLLLAEAKGYATSPMLGFDADKVKALFGLPAHVRIPAIVSIGYAGETGAAPHRLDIDSLVHFR